MATTVEMRTCELLAILVAYDVVKQSRSAFVVSLRCDRCGAIRSDVIDSHGFLASRYYSYPENYRDAEISAGSRDDKRAWLLKELLYEGKWNVVPIKRKKAANG